METEFTPLWSLAGGLLIGLAASILMLTAGRVAGVSGILAGLLPPLEDRAAVPPGVAFILGLLLAVPAYVFATDQVPVQFVSGNLALLAAAGLLVGFGTVFGGGCTSGHGVCGISRLSRRSITATLVFMATAFITVFVWRHLLGGS